MRPSNRKNDEIRHTSIETNFNKYAEGSCLIKMQNTHVICTASVEDRVPPFLRGKNQGWLSAEYSMLPRSTHSRSQRLNATKPNGRALEIQRLIGRSLRSTLDMKMLGERQITIDCDVIQADGGTRCASITGGYVALALAIKNLREQNILRQNPLKSQIAAISCGLYQGQVVADLDYDEDSNCQTDGNFILNENGEIIEIQSTAEHGSLSFEQFSKMFEFAKNSIFELVKIQNEAIKNG